MCRLLETIRVESKRFFNLPYHNRRLNRSRRELFGDVPAIDLERVLRIPPGLGTGRFKCRVICNTSIRSVEFEPYELKPVTCLKIVDGRGIAYGNKYADRNSLNRLHALREDCDDVLIVRDGKITDTTYANVAFFTGIRWYTPNTYLLPGTKRRQLIDSGELQTKEIAVSDLSSYVSVALINAMIDLGEVTLPVSSIIE